MDKRATVICLNTPSPDALSAYDRELHAGMSDDERANYNLMNRLARLGRYIEATNSETGVRSRFEFAEHVNVGPGWMMLDVDRKHRGVVSSFRLVDAVSLGNGPLL
jgi:hypothetical protein